MSGLEGIQVNWHKEDRPESPAITEESAKAPESWEEEEEDGDVSWKRR